VCATGIGGALACIPITKLLLIMQPDSEGESPFCFETAAGFIQRQKSEIHVASFATGKSYVGSGEFGEFTDSVVK
jgi:archaellum biogenesis ATPase FlaH